MMIDLPRLRLRAFKPADAAAVITAMNDWDVAQWLIVPPFPYGEADFRQFAETVQQDYLSAFPRKFALAQRDTYDIVGCMAIAAKDGGSGELGYWIARACWGQGLASEAAPAVIAAAERDLELQRLFATTDPANLASRRLLERCGFFFSGEIRREKPTRRGTPTACLYERIRSGAVAD
jgi:RimJ/RimL family protein N-acetyltransferase